LKKNPAGCQFFFPQLKPLLIAALPFVLGSCMTMADYNYSKINSNLSEGKYADVRAELDEQKKVIYSSHDEVLYCLDTGILEHFEGLTSDSSRMLSEAEKLIEKYSAVSITQSLAGAVTNDMAKDYRGEDFENIYSNIFMSLNYLQEKNLEDAMVEVRRFDNKLKVLKEKYEAEVNESNSKSDVKINKVSIQFSNSALARYLSMIMYRSQNDSGNARVDYNLLKSAWQTQPSLYDFPLPSSIEGELSVPDGKARLNILAFSGRAPVKKENVIRVPYNHNRWYKLSLPEMTKQPSQINSITVKAVNDATGEIHTARVEKIESIENIAADTFQQNYSAIFARSLIRSISRQLVTSGIDAVRENNAIQNNLGAQLIVGTFGLMHQIATEAVERADVRCSRYFPAQAGVAGFNLDPGSYTVTVDFCHNKSVKYSQTQKIRAFAGNLNLVEAACLR
jgi:hypothetical protein